MTIKDLKYELEHLHEDYELRPEMTIRELEWLCMKVSRHTAEVGLKLAVAR
ncbi:MAG: hypothetical protein KJ556_20010 [Gammaproteobacteria bacterium]|nr:hypothetical protein [Gammaproteobacteria bacterium]